MPFRLLPNSNLFTLLVIIIVSQLSVVFAPESVLSIR